MIYPSADRLEELVESRYTLVVLAAKRARQLREGAPKLINTTSTNPLTIALEEIAAGKITCHVANNDEIITQEEQEIMETLPGLESAVQEEAAELTGETPAPVDEAARVAQLLEVPVEEETTEEAEAEPEAEVAAEPEAEAAPEEPAASPEEEPAAQAEEAQEEVSEEAVEE